MSIEGLMVSLVIIGLLLGYVLRPLLFAPRMNIVTLSDKQRERALAYYERVLSNIRDLDDDHNADKIHPQEYQVERELWAERGVRVLKLLDELNEQHPITENPLADDAEIDALIEAQINAVRTEEGKNLA
jgi:hypothetical protein